MSDSKLMAYGYRIGPPLTDLPSPAGSEMARRQIDVESVSSIVGRSRVQALTAVLCWFCSEILSILNWDNTRPV